MAKLAWQADYDNQVRVDFIEYWVAGLSDRVVFTFKPVGFSLGSVLSVNWLDADIEAILVQTAQQQQANTQAISRLKANQAALQTSVQ